MAPTVDDTLHEDTQFESNSVRNREPVKLPHHLACVDLVGTGYESSGGV